MQISSIPQGARQKDVRGAGAAPSQSLPASDADVFIPSTQNDHVEFTYRERLDQERAKPGWEDSEARQAWLHWG